MVELEELYKELASTIESILNDYENGETDKEDAIDAIIQEVKKIIESLE